MKKLIIIAALFFGTKAYSQIIPQNQTIKVGVDFSPYASKHYADSLHAIGYTNTQVDSAIAAHSGGGGGTSRNADSLVSIPGGQFLLKSDSALANRIRANTTNIVTNATNIAGKQNTITNIADSLKYLKKGDSAIYVSSYVMASVIANLALKANESAVVHNTGTESVAGKKIFTDGFTIIANTFAVGSYVADFQPSPGGVGGIRVVTYPGNGNYMGLVNGSSSIGNVLKNASFNTGLAIPFEINSRDLIITNTGGTGFGYPSNSVIPEKVGVIGNVLASGTFMAPNMTDSIGNFVTGNSGNGKFHTRTPAEVLSDIGALGTAANAASATKLNTARTIAGVAFDGTTNISLNNNAITNGANYVKNTDSLSASLIKKSAGKIDTSLIPTTHLAGKNIIKVDSTGPNTLTVSLDSTKMDSTVRAIAATITVGNQYANQAAALADGKTNGYVYKLPPDANGNHLLAVMDTVLEPALRLTVDNTSGLYSKMNMKFSYNGPDTLRVDWGDGSNNIYVTPDGSSPLVPIHTYSTSAVFDVTIKSNFNDRLQEIYLNTASDTVKSGIKRVTGVYLYTTLNVLRFSNGLVTNIDTLSLPSTLTELSANNNKITSINRSLPISLVTLSLNSNLLVSANFSNYPTSVEDFYLNDNILPSSVINSLLIWIDSNVSSGAIGDISLWQRTAAPPTGAGATAKSSLISKGLTVTTD